MSAIVVDTSLAVKWALQEEFTQESRALLRTWVRASVQLTVPSWFACEFANVLFQQLRTGRTDLIGAQEALRDALSNVTSHDVEPAVSVRALEIADQLKQRASYDAQYLALAEHLDCELWTADQRFWNAARPAFPRIRWVGEVSSGPAS